MMSALSFPIISFKYWGASTGDTLKLSGFPGGFSLELSDETFERKTALLGYQPERCKINLHKIER